VAFDESSLQWVDAVLFLMALFETLREYSYQRLIMDAASQIIVESHAFLLIQGGHVWVQRTIVSCVGNIKEAERYGVVDILPQG
jgi:hypothetical protein